MRGGSFEDREEQALLVLQSLMNQVEVSDETAIFLSSITIARAPGFGANQFPVIEEFSDSLNIIYGPNGVGKSTLLRNLRALIYQRETETRSEAYGRLRIGEDVWELERSGKVVKQLRQRDGAIIDLPGVNEEFRESYWFALHSLSPGAATSYGSLKWRSGRCKGIDLDQAERARSDHQFAGKGSKKRTVVAAKAKLNESRNESGNQELGEEIQR